MKRPIFTLFLTLSLFALCAVPAFAEESPIPSFEERKEMAIEAAFPYVQSFMEEQGTEWNPENLTAEAYPSRGMLSVTSKAHITADEIAQYSRDMILLFYSDNQPLMTACTRYIPETGETDFLMYGDDGEVVQKFSDQVEVFNQIKTEDSPICVVSGFHVNYLYGHTIYGDNMLMEVAPYPEELESAYFQSMDTDGYPLIMIEDFEYMIEQAWEHSDRMGGGFTQHLPPYNHAMVVRNRWIFGTAGVLLLIGFIAYRVYRAKRQAKAE